MQLDLHPGRTLAREDVVQVMANLTARGYHLQMPPGSRPTSTRGTDADPVETHRQAALQDRSS